MRRIHLTVEYDGSAYAGWQRQSNAMTVQEKLERAVKRLTGETVCVSGASRTDAGVHALGQSAHFDTESRIPADKFSFETEYLEKKVSGGQFYAFASDGYFIDIGVPQDYAKAQEDFKNR